MNVSAINEYSDRGKAVLGPADLANYGEGDTLIIRGTIVAADQARWAPAIMSFVARGGKIG